MCARITVRTAEDLDRDGAFHTRDRDEQRARLDEGSPARSVISTSTSARAR